MFLFSHSADCNTPGFPVLHHLPSPSATPMSLLKLISTESVKLSNHLILCHPHLLLPSIFPSIRVFSNVWVLGSISGQGTRPHMLKLRPSAERERKKQTKRERKKEKPLLPAGAATVWQSGQQRCVQSHPPPSHLPLLEDPSSSSQRFPGAPAGSGCVPKSVSESRQTAARSP